MKDVESISARAPPQSFFGCSTISLTKNLLTQRSKIRAHNHDTMTQLHPTALNQRPYIRFGSSIIYDIIRNRRSKLVHPFFQHDKASVSFEILDTGSHLLAALLRPSHCTYNNITPPKVAFSLSDVFKCVDRFDAPNVGACYANGLL